MAKQPPPRIHSRKSIAESEQLLHYEDTFTRNPIVAPAPVTRRLGMDLIETEVQKTPNETSKDGNPMEIPSEFQQIKNLKPTNNFAAIAWYFDPPESRMKKIPKPSA